MSLLSRRDLLRRATVLAAGLSVARLRRLEDAIAAAPGVVHQTMQALASFVAPGEKLGAATVPRLIRTLDRFLPGPLPLSATAASILNETAGQVNPASRRGRSPSAFANLSTREQAEVFETLERLPVETAGPIRFLVGNLPDLTAFLAFSARSGWRLTRYAGLAEGRKELKGYWQGRKAVDSGA